MSNSNFNKSEAIIKMVALTEKSEAENVVWYNFLKHNNWEKSKIIDGMKRRFLSSGIASTTRVLQFYDNATGNLIEEHR